MQIAKTESRYDLRIVDLLIVAVLAGCAHYLSSLLSDYHSALSLSGAIISANVGITASFGVVVYCAYRFFWPRSG